MTTIAPIDNRIIKKDPERFRNLFPIVDDLQVSNLLTANNVFANELDITLIKDTINDNISLNTFLTCSETITTQVLNCNGSVSAVSFNSTAPPVSGVVVLDIGGVSLPTTSGANSGKHLPVRIGGTIYKIKLENN